MNNKEELNKDLLTIPIYLNTKIVFDMLATIEDGFSVVKNIQTSRSKDKENEVDAEVGSGNIFAFLNIGLKGKIKDTSKGNETYSEERTHTTVSLFQKLKHRLEEAGLVIRNYSCIQIGDFIELQGNFKMNPLISMLSRIKEMMAIYNLFSEKIKQNNGKKDKVLSDAKFNAQIDGLINGLQANGKRDIVCETENINILLPTYDSYFINNNMNEVTDGNYKFLGKVVQKCVGDGEISLLRNTVFSKLQVEKLKDFEAIINDDSLKPFFSEKIATSVKAPVIMAIPIAIYI